MAPVKFTSTKGADKRTIHGYIYRKKRILKSGKTSWECDQRRYIKCKARMETSGEDFELFGDHSHQPNPGKCKAEIVQSNIRKNIITTAEKPATVVRDATQGLSPSATVNLSSLRQMRETARGIRRRQLVYPIPTNTVDLNIPQEFRETLTGENFLVYDSGPGNDRIIMFSTDSALEQLKTSEEWFLDGTFKTSPLMFQQLYTIHAKIEGLVIPLVFCLLPNKNQQTYYRLFHQLCQLKRFLPRNILLDFEQAVITALPRFFPGATIRGCFFHFQQCLWRKIQNIPEVLRKYKQSEDYSEQITYLAALAFRKPVDVRNSYLELRETPFFQQIELKELLDYFEYTWVGIPPSNICPNWIDSVFGYELWNVYETLENNWSRTNNYVEGWHSRFQSLLDCHHPSIFKFFATIKGEEDQARLSLIQLEAGIIPHRGKPKYIRLQNRLVAIAGRYNRLTCLRYLRRIAYNLIID